MTDERLQSDGAIYTNNYKRTSKQPDWTGKITLSKELLKQLVTKMRSENADSAEMRVALWNRTSKAGNEYKYARLDVQQEKKEEPKPEPMPEVDEFSDDEIPF